MRPLTLALVLCLSGGLADDASAFLASELQPLEVGNSWTYLEDGANITRTVVGTAPVDGATTFVIEELTGPEAGSQEFQTNGPGGLLSHRVFVTGVDGSTSTFTPPTMLLQADFAASSGFTSTGALDFFVPGTGTFSGTYSNQVSVMDLETVNVMAGMFQALRVDSMLTLTIDLGGGDMITGVGTDSTWYAPGVGIVRFSGQFDGDPFSGELVSTNVPEPVALLLLFVGVACLVRS